MPATVSRAIGGRLYVAFVLHEAIGAIFKPASSSRSLFDSGRFDTSLNFYNNIRLIRMNCQPKGVHLSNNTQVGSDPP
jgi:hypothetical protein